VRALTRRGTAWGRRFGLAAVLATGALSMAAPAAWGAGAWYEIGTDPSPVNHAATGNAVTPSAAGLSGSPFVSWMESAVISGSANPVDQVRVAGQNSTPFEARPWSELLSSGRFSLNLDPAHEARQPHLAMVNGVPYEAWIENDGTADQIRVARWDGSTWSSVGSAINTGTPVDLSLTSTGNVPAVAWTETGGGVYAKRFISNAWTSMGTGALNFVAGSTAREVQIVDGGGQPYLTWSEVPSGQSIGHIRVARYLDGAPNLWQSVGSGTSPISTAANDAHHPSFAVINGENYVAWSEHDSAAAADLVYVDHFNSSSNWETMPYVDVGSSALNLDRQGHATDPSLANIGGQLWVAWTEQPSGGGAFGLEAAQFQGTQSSGSWITAGPLNHDTSHNAHTPSLADAGPASYPFTTSTTVAPSGPAVAPVLAWSETDSSGNGQIRVAAFGDAPQNTGRPQISGTPKGGSQLSCDHGSWAGSPSKYTTLWERGLRSATTDSDPSWHVIGGASGDTYTVQSDDFGSRVRCRVVASNGIVSAEAVSTSKRTDADKPSFDTPPTVTGRLVVGSTLTCDTGPATNWHNAPGFTYQWTRDGQPISGANQQTYRPTRYRSPNGAIFSSTGDGDHNIGCTVIGSNDLGASAPVSSPTVHVVDWTPIIAAAPRLIVQPPSANHTSVLTRVVICVTGSADWYEDYGQYQYQWLRNGAPISNAITNRYLPTVDDIGRKLTCQVIATNPAGASGPNVSAPYLVPIPQGINDITVHKEGPTNAVDPTNLLPLTSRYADALRFVVIQQLLKGINGQTSSCQNLIKIKHQGRFWTTSAPDPASVHDPITGEMRCRILLYAKERVQPYFDGGVRYLSGKCTAVPDAVTAGTPLCPSLGIQGTPVDPLKPPQLGSLVQTVPGLAPATPQTIIWDLDHNGTADASCAGSAPVLRSILKYHRNWDPRVTIIDQDGTIHTGDLKFNLPGGVHSLLGGSQRPGQVKVCGTSLDPPPTPELPCVTGGDIGSVHISNANLCPIDARTIQDADFENLLSGGLKQYLLRVSEQQLANSGTAAAPAQDGPGPAPTVYVPWAAPVHAAPDPNGPTVLVNGGRYASNAIYSALANGVAALTSENSTAKYPALNLGGKYLKSFDPMGIHSDWLKFAYNADNAPLAYDQIYVARAPATSGARSALPGSVNDLGSLMVNGVGMQAVKDATGAPTAALLVPTDVNGALPDVHSMSLVGREVASYMGLPSDPKAIPLALKGELNQTLKDQANAAGSDLLRQTNISQMLERAKQDGTAQGQQLLAQLKKSLDLGPFSLDGAADVKIEKDGTATLTVGASLPGLTGVDANGKPGGNLEARATIHADLQGHLALRGIHLQAANAFLFGINLSGVALDYDSNSGFKVKAQITFPALGGQGIDLKALELGTNGEFRRLAVDYLAGAGAGIPVGYGIFVTTLGFDINFAAESFLAHIVLSVGSSTGKGCPALGADTSLQAKLSEPASLDGDVNLLATCLKLGNVHFTAREDGYIAVTGKWGINSKLVSFNIALGAQFKLPDYQIYAHGDGQIIGIIKGLVDAVLSNRGLAACGSLDVTIPIVGDVLSIFTGSRTIHVAAGASVDFINGRPPLSEPEILDNLTLFTGCDIGHYYPLGMPKFASDAKAGSTGFRLGAHMGPTLISLEGVGSAPHVILHSPSGQVLDFSNVTGDRGKLLPSGAWGTIVNSENRTVVILPRPQGGLWTADLAPGSSAIVRIRRAQILPPPAMRVRVSGRGSRRALHYTIARAPGQTVRFVEQANGDDTILGSVRRGGKGVINYTVGEARSTRRQIVAEVFQNGVPRKRLTVAHYSAPNAAVGRAGHLRVRRAGRRALISWSAATLARNYLVQITYGTGERVLLEPRAGVRHAVAGHVTRGEGVLVRVFARSPAGRVGPGAVARLSGSMLVGAVRKTPKYTYKKAKPHKKSSAHKKKTAKRHK
jgi:hypothetical protein